MTSGGSPGQRAQERKLLLPSSFCFLPPLLQIGSFFPFIPCWGFPLRVLEPTSSGFQCRLETGGSPGTTQDVSTLWDCWDIQPHGLCNCWILGPPICLSACRPACLPVCPSDYPWVFTWLDFVQVLEIIIVFWPTPNVHFRQLPNKALYFNCHTTDINKDDEQKRILGAKH